MGNDERDNEPNVNGNDTGNIIVLSELNLKMKKSTVVLDSPVQSSHLDLNVATLNRLALIRTHYLVEK